MEKETPINDLPVIAIVTSTFNAGKYLEGLIQSVIKQTYPALEFIIVDAKSMDNTLEIIKRYQDKITSWVSEADSGVYDAWNKALQRTKAEWICFIGADDFIVDERAIEMVVPHLISQIKKNKKYVYGRVNLVSESQLDLIETMGSEWENLKGGFGKKMTLAHCGSFHHKSLFLENGLFNTEFKIAGDYEFLLREYVKDGDFACFIPITIVNMRSGGLSGNLKNRLLTAQEVSKARHLNGLRKISLPILIWIFRVRLYLFAQWLLGDKISARMVDLYRRIRVTKQ